VLPNDVFEQLELRGVIEQVVNDWTEAFVDGHQLESERYPGI
jgi:hypothetical protein